MTNKLCANCGREIAATEAFVMLSSNAPACMDCVNKAVNDVTLQPRPRARRSARTEREPVKPRDAMLEFLRAEREFAVSHRINPENWESDYLAKPDDDRERVQADWLRFLSAFSSDFRSRR